MGPTALLGIAGALLVLGADGDVRPPGAAWGPARLVAVAVRDLPAGHVITDDDVRSVDLPDLPAPPWMADDPVGWVTTAGIRAGELVSRARVAPRGTPPAAARIGAGRVAIAIPVDERTPRLAPEDEVVLYGPRLLTDDGVVIEVHDRAATLGVPADDAPSIMDALATDTVLIAVRGPMPDGLRVTGDG